MSGPSSEQWKEFKSSAMGREIQRIADQKYEKAVAENLEATEETLREAKERRKEAKFWKDLVETKIKTEEEREKTNV